MLSRPRHRWGWGGWDRHSPTTSHEPHNYTVPPQVCSTSHTINCLTCLTCLTCLPQFIQDVFYNHSFRLRLLGPIPHPCSIAHNVLIHRRGHPNLPCLHNTHCSYNNYHIHSSSIHNDPHPGPRYRNTYVHYHSTRKRNLIDTRSTPSVHSSGSAIYCARSSSPSGC